MMVCLMPWRRHSSQLEGIRHNGDRDRADDYDRRRTSDQKQLEHDRRVAEMREFLDQQSARLRNAVDHS